jgi:hypothetical protein
MFAGDEQWVVFKEKPAATVRSTHANQQNTASSTLQKSQPGIDPDLHAEVLGAPMWWRAIALVLDISAVIKHSAEGCPKEV